MRKGKLITSHPPTCSRARFAQLARLGRAAGNSRQRAAEPAIDERDHAEQVRRISAASDQPQNVSISTDQATGSFNLVTGSPLHGVEFLVRTEITDPLGNSHKGQGHFENFVFGRFDPCGFK